jgi:signal transduction histidine kinase
MESQVAAIVPTVRWDEGPLPDDVVALVVDVRGGAPDAPPPGLPAVVVHAGDPPMWATFSVPAPEADSLLARAVVAAACDGAALRALRSERSLVAELVDLVCHDARNPLAAIQANLGLLESTSADDDSRESIADSQMAAEAALRIVDNLALAAASEAGRGKSARGTSDARAALASALRRAARSAEISGIPIAATLPPSGAPCGCAADVLEAILDNLIAAAVRHAPRGTDVRLELGADRGSVRIAISEAGTPVDGALRGRLFDRAFQPMSKRTPSARYARGLGLYVAGLLAASCGARLESVAVDGRNVYRLDLPPARE